MGLLLLLAAACGDGGPSVPACQAEASPEPSVPSSTQRLTLRVGSYEGTGSPQCIRGVGFDPVAVIIKGEAGEWTVWRSLTMEGDSSTDFASGKANFEDGITSLEPDAFSLGEDASVNADGVTYHYVAFADSPDVSVGSYAGDGAAGRSITGVGFEPALLFLKRDGARSAVWRSDIHPEGVASFFHGGDDTSGLISAFELDGFQVSGDPFVNASDGSTYHYVAFRAAPGLLKADSYVGDGSDSRDIAGVGFQPDYVWVKSSSRLAGAVHRPASLSDSGTLRFANVPNGTGEITALSADGFSIGPEPAVNSEDETYYYVAWKSSDSP